MRFDDKKPLLALIVLALSACSDDAEPPPSDPATCVEGCVATLSEPIQIVPGDGLPAEIELQPANNNLDVIEHDGRVFMAFRTGPTHFASAEVRMHVVSSADRQSWRFEGTFFRETDLREPRFLSLDGELFLYFAVLGDDPLAFEPQGTLVTRYRGDGAWTEPEPFLDGNFIPWRTRIVDGVPYMLAYTGGENIYELDGEGLHVHFLTTEDGIDWHAVVPDHPVVLEGGSSETDFVFLDDGSLVAVSRNEAGDDLGFGMKICRAEADALHEWACVADPKKYDSPLLFRHGPNVYLIGRRNVTETGNYDLGMDDLSLQQQRLQYQLDYWRQPKRCSLWQIDPESLEVSFIVDLPSRGDTCFPGILRDGPDTFTVFNYTSPLDGEDVGWSTGQSGDTNIYRIELTFEPVE